MRRTGLLDGLLASGPDEQTVTHLAQTAAGSVDSDEAVVFRLPGTGRLVHQTSDDETVVETEGSLALVTDHRVLLVAGSRDDTHTLELPHTDTRTVTVDGGLFGTTLTVTCWNSGTYRFEMAGSDPSDAVAYIETAADCWGYVETLLAELDGQIAAIRSHIEAGEHQQATGLFTTATETVTELDERVEAAGLTAALGDRIGAVRRRLHRARVDSRVSRARSLLDAAASMSRDGTDYVGAYERYTEARSRLETADSVARAHDLDTAEVAAVRAQVDRGLDRLAALPVERAEHATARALVTDDCETRVQLLADALARYRDALALGWGTDIETPADTDELRFRIALLANGLVDARCAYAARLESAGDEHATDGEEAAARAQYRAARAQLAAGADLAREFRTPDPDPVERKRSEVAWKLDVLTGRDTTSATE